jgi:hypothetical protein
MPRRNTSGSSTRQKFTRPFGDPTVFSVHDLADLYGLPEETVEEELLASLSHSLTNLFGYEVEAMLNDAGNLELYGYTNLRGDLQVRNIPLERIGRSALREIRRALTQNLVTTCILQEYDLLRQFTGRVLDGIVTKISESRALFVQLHPEDLYLGKKALIGFCPLRNQTPQERHIYRPGDILAFHVLKVITVCEDGIPWIDVILSRNSKRLVEGLLMKQIQQDPAMRNVKIKCVKRIAGAYSVIGSSVPLPMQVVKNVSSELKEFIRMVRLR